MDGFLPPTLGSMDSPVRNKEDFWNLAFTAAFAFACLALMAYLSDVPNVFVRVGVWDFFLLSFASFRLIRLFTYDKITAFLRDYLAARSGAVGKTLHSLIICPWCTGVWTSLLVVTLFFVPYAQPILLVLAVAGIASSVQVIMNAVSRLFQP